MWPLLQHHFLSSLWSEQTHLSFLPELLSSVSSSFPLFRPLSKWGHLYLHFPIGRHIHKWTAFSCAASFLWGGSDHFPDCKAVYTISEIPETVCCMLTGKCVSSLFWLNRLDRSKFCTGGQETALYCVPPIRTVFICKLRKGFASNRSLTLTSAPPCPPEYASVPIDMFSCG